MQFCTMNSYTISTCNIKPIVIFLASFFFIFGRYTVNAQETITVKQGTIEKEVLLLPSYYPVDSTMISKGGIKVTHLKKNHGAFKSQLYQAALKTVNGGGNVFMVSRMQDRNQKGNYKVWGASFHSPEYAQLKAKAVAYKNKKLENGRYGYLIVYRPQYRSGFNDDIEMELTVNDTLKLDMKANTKYLIQVSKDCDVKIATRKDAIVQHVHVQPGNRYYTRAYTNIPGVHRTIKVGESNTELNRFTPYFEIIDDVQGDLESSLVNLITITKKI